MIFSRSLSLRALLSCLFLFLCFTTTEANGKKVAFLVGVNEYKKPGFANLKYAERDVSEVGKVLDQLGFSVTVLKGKDATKSAIDSSLREIVETLGKDDLMLVMLAGHGEQKTKKEAYYCPYDSISNNAETMFSIDHLLSDILEPNVGKRLVLIDACRNDPDPSRSRGIQGKKISLQEGTTILFSCSAGEKAIESDKLRHGLFTYCVLEGLRGGAADKRSGEIRLSPLTSYVKQRMSNDDIKQHFPAGQIQTPIDPSGGLPITILGKISKATKPELLVAPFGKFTAERTQKAWAAYLNQPLELNNSIGVKLRLVPPGKFVMGAKYNPSNQEKPHTVQITKPFYVSRYEVTRGQFADFVNATNHKTTLEKNDRGTNRGWDSNQYRFLQKTGFSWYNPGWSQEKNHPVVNVSWDDTKYFVDWLSRKEGKNYRLLSEAEWEYCCRAGTTTIYTTGNSPTDLVKVGNVLDNTGVGTFQHDKNFGPTAQNQKIAGNDGYVFTSPVGSFRANNFGLNDFHGNVCEWCNDWFTPSYQQLGEFDPQGASRGTDRSARGGRFDTGAVLAKSHTRNHGPAGMSDMILGFRIALDIEQ